ncbi:MAG TPA: AAA family ATPase [Candidatus Nanoarchaeia archaeon]|nr:AAA family ATPase [Candidatus Nanoarchaeia archaeon]
MGKVIGIMSLKGGVGKTSVVASLGSALAELGKNVLLIDANFHAPNLGIHFNLIDPEVTLHDVLSRKANVRDAIYAVGNLDILPSSIFTNQKINVLKLKDKIQPLRKKYDIILIDSPPSLAEDGLATLYAADEIFFVTTPDHSTLSNTIKSINRSNERGTKVDGIILNKVYDKDFELSVEQIESTANIPIMAVIPHEVSVLEAQSKFIPSTQWKPSSKGSKEFRKLAATLIGEPERVKSFDWRRIFGITPQKQEVNRQVFYERVFK